MNTPRKFASSHSPVPAAVSSYPFPSGDSLCLYTSADFPVHPLCVLPGPLFLPPTLCVLPARLAFSGFLCLLPLGPVRAPFPSFPQRLGRMRAAPQHSLSAGSVLRLVLVHRGYPWLGILWSWSCRCFSLSGSESRAGKVESAGMQGISKVAKWGGKAWGELPEAGPQRRIP